METKNEHGLSLSELDYCLDENQTRLWYLIPSLAPKDYSTWQDNREALQKDFPKTDRFLMDCHNMPSQEVIALHMYDELLDTCGIEYIQAMGKIILYYCNTGESYQNTVCFNPINQTFIVSSWADFWEEFEKNQYDEYTEQWQNWGCDEFKKGLSFLVSDLTESEQDWFADLDDDTLQKLYESKLSSYYEVTASEMILYTDQAVEDTTLEDLQALFKTQYIEGLERLYSQSLLTGVPDIHDDVLRLFWDSRTDIDWAAVEAALQD
jgi:hypothetical protein